MTFQALSAASDVRASGTLDKERRKAVFCAAVGGALEFFDFATYGFFASVISGQFFPAADHATALIASFAVFGVGFIARPLGSVFFGRVGDLKGRKYALQIAFPLMGFATLGVGLIPSYFSIGVAAPLLLVFFRLLQGFSTGGESGNAITYLLEWAPSNRRAFYTSFAHSAAVAGTVVSAGLAALLSSTLSSDALESWGWRIPFLIGGLVITPIGYYLRTNVSETPRFVEEVLKHSADVEQTNSRMFALNCLRAFAFASIWAASFYVYMIYVPAFLVRHGHIQHSDALWITTAGFAMQACCIVAAGRLSDAIGRKPPLVMGAIIFFVISYPMFVFFTTTSSILFVLIAILLCSALIGLLAGSSSVAMAEMFPTRIRTTGVSISYGVGVAIFGGFASAISEFLVTATGSPLSPSFFVMAAALISLCVVLTSRETGLKPLID